MSENKEIKRPVGPETDTKNKQEIDIQKSIDENLGNRGSTNHSWKPIVDTTESTPPSGGSGVKDGNSKDKK